MTTILIIWVAVIACLLGFGFALFEKHEKLASGLLVAAFILSFGLLSIEIDGTKKKKSKSKNP